MSCLLQNCHLEHLRVSPLARYHLVPQEPELARSVRRDPELRAERQRRAAASGGPPTVQLITGTAVSMIRVAVPNVPARVASPNVYCAASALSPSLPREGQGG